jgi:hypothetical protein
MELRGTLGDFSLEVIFSLISNGHKTGRLHLMLTRPDGGKRDVDLSFAAGEIVSVISDSLHGLDALREAAVCSEGSFEFAVSGMVDAEGPADPIPMDVARATMEAARSEATSLGAALSSLGGTLKHGFPSIDTITISPEEFGVLAVLRDGMTVGEVVAASTAPTLESMRIIQQLVDRGLLTLEAADLS